MKFSIFIAVIVVLSAQYAHAQHLFPEKFDGCITDRFALEKNTTQAKVGDELLVTTIVKAFDEKTRQKMSGVLTLQIIVDTFGVLFLCLRKLRTL
jgi:hypothetical protein